MPSRTIYRGISSFRRVILILENLRMGGRSLIKFSAGITNELAKIFKICYNIIIGILYFYGRVAMAFYIFFICMYIIAGITSYFVIWTSRYLRGRNETFKWIMFILCIVAWPVCIFAFVERLINNYIEDYVENTYMKPKARSKAE